MQSSMTRKLCALGACTALIGGALVASLSSAASPADATTTNPIPKYDHVVLAIFENHSQSELASGAPYLTGLAKQGVNFTNSWAVDHHSEPNYLALFSGNEFTQYGTQSDACLDSTNNHSPLGDNNVGNQLITAGKSFVGYAESMPNAGYTSCDGSSGLYQRKHAPWTNFSDLTQTTVSRPFSEFPTTATSNFAALPTFSFVVPNMCNDMHNDCSTDGSGTNVKQGNDWAQTNLAAYANWAPTHNSLLIVTSDEDDFSNQSDPVKHDTGGNTLATNGGQIMTFFVGANITPGATNTDAIDHYNVLRTIEDMYGLPHLGQATNRAPITDAWSTAPAPSPSPSPSPAPAGALVSGGVYAIGTAGANEYLDDPYSSTTAGARLVIWSGSTLSNHRWTAKDAGNGYYTFVNVASGQCLGNTGSLNAGASIVQNTCTGYVSQSWKLVATTGGYKLVNKYSGLVVTPSGTTDGTYLTQQAGSQAWTFTKVG